MSPRSTRWSLRSVRSRSRRAASRPLLLACLLALAVLLAACGTGDLPQDTLSNLDGHQAREVDRLWDIVFPVATVIFFFVQGLILFIVLRFRARSDDDAPVQVHGNAKLELTWTIIPALLLAVVGVFTVVTVFDINERASGADTLQVEVIGHQWWWEYRYPAQQGIEDQIITANELVIPAGREVQLQLTSADVIHNFWPPKLAGKVYAIPGRTNYMRINADHPGDYSGQCSEYCGLSHANMRLRVIALDQGAFETWAEGQQETAAPAPTTTTTVPPTTTTIAAGAAGTTDTASEDVGADNAVPVGTDPVLDRAMGAELFVAKGCSGCHTISGLEGANGKVGPNLTHLFSRKRFAGAVFELNDRNVRRWLRNPSELKPMNPTNGQGMPDLGLTEDEITQLIAYLETLT